MMLTLKEKRILKQLNKLLIKFDKNSHLLFEIYLKKDSKKEIEKNDTKDL